MERSVALKKLGKILGKKLAYRINDKAPTQEERDTAKAEMPQAVAEREDLKKKRDERYRAILEADAEYQGLRNAYDAARKRTDELFSIQNRHKITVGTNEGLFFFVKAEGDSWEEVIDKLTAKQAA